MGEPGQSVDRGGALNLLTPERSQTNSTHSLAAANALVQICLWDGKIKHNSAAFARAIESKQAQRTPEPVDLVPAE
jgi:trimethylamine-N-oxide reductase (cytochrome c)